LRGGAAGSIITDTFTANSKLAGSSFFSQHHSYGLWWQPGKSVTWFIDGKALFEITDEALRPQVRARVCM
jgi:uncharacterized membrane protein